MSRVVVHYWTDTSESLGEGCICFGLVCVVFFQNILLAEVCLGAHKGNILVQHIDKLFF